MACSVSDDLSFTFGTRACADLQAFKRHEGPITLSLAEAAAGIPFGICECTLEHASQLTKDRLFLML